MKLYFLILLSFGLLFQHYVCEQSSEDGELDVSVDGIAITAGPHRSNGNQKDREILRKKLFTDYDRKNIPDNNEMEFGMSITKFDVDEKRGTFEVDGWLKYMWNDNRLTWDAKENNIDVIRACPKEVWKPDITLFNNAHPEDMNPCGDSNVLIYSNGNVLWVPPCHFSAHCNLTHAQTPEGPEQSCFLKFGSWTYDYFSMKLSIYKNETKANTDDMWENNHYKLTHNSVTWVNKYYSCCEEPYPYINFDFSFRKKAEFCM